MFELPDLSTSIERRERAERADRAQRLATEIANAGRATWRLRMTLSGLLVAGALGALPWLMIVRELATGAAPPGKIFFLLPGLFVFGSLGLILALLIAFPLALWYRRARTRRLRVQVQEVPAEELVPLLDCIQRVNYGDGKKIVQPLLREALARWEHLPIPSPGGLADTSSLPLPAEPPKIAPPG
jgi:hypothetical protein